MLPILLYINAWPGTGKQTIATALIPHLPQMRLLLDNHKIIDLAKTIAGGTTHPNQPETYQKVRSQILEAAVTAALDTISTTNPAGFIMTGAHARDFPDVYLKVQSLVQSHSAISGVTMVGVVLTISEGRNLERLTSGLNRGNKLQDPLVLKEIRASRELFRMDTPYLLELDVSELTAEQSAEQIRDFVLPFMGNSTK